MKYRRIATADSPAPFPSFHLEVTRVFPPVQSGERRTADLDDLVLFIREHNRSKSSPIVQSSRTDLKIWAPSRPKSGSSRCVSDPLIVRVVIRDVTTVFVKLRQRNRDRGAGALCVESVVALGPREKVGRLFILIGSLFTKLPVAFRKVLIPIRISWYTRNSLNKSHGWWRRSRTFHSRN